MGVAPLWRAMFEAVRLEVLGAGRSSTFAASLEGGSAPDVASRPCLVTGEESGGEVSKKGGNAVFTGGSVILDIRGGRLESRLVSSPKGRSLNGRVVFWGDRGDVGFVPS